jgi:hypothetical protein
VTIAHARRVGLVYAGAVLRLTSWAGAASVAFVAGVGVLTAPRVASAQTALAGTAAPGAGAPSGAAAEPSASALVAARELFREAGQDADAGKFGLALEKYRRVVAVKETGQVRFNIARCEEQLGQIASALADYELVERDLRDVHGDAENELRNTSRDRGNALRPRVPRLTLMAPLPEPPNFVVRLDGAVIADAALGVPLPVDPGRHRVEASAGGRLPLTAELEVREKEARRVPLELEKSAAGQQADVGTSTSSDGSTQRALGWVAIGGGVVMGALSIVFLAEHNSIVSDVTAAGACPNDGQCVSASARTSAEGRQSGANTTAGLSVGFAIGAVAAAGAGVGLVLTARSNPTQVAIHPGAPGAPGGASLAFTF